MCIVLHDLFQKLVAWSMFGGGHWIRVHLTHWLDDHILRETVYVVWYPHTPILFVLGRVKARTRLALFDVSSFNLPCRCAYFYIIYRVIEE